VGVDDDHPAPGSENEPEVRPAASKRGAEQREPLEGLQRTLDARLRVGRQAVRANQLVEVLGGGRAQLDAGQELEIVERGRLTGLSLCRSELGAFVGAEGVVDKLGLVLSIGVSL